MAEAALVLAVVAAGAGVVNAVQQRKAAKKAAAEQRKQRDISNRQQSIDRQRQIRQAIAAQRVQLARQQQGGVMGSSAVGGMTSSLGTDLATSLGAANTQMAAQYGISQSQNREAGYSMTAQQGTMFGTVSQLAGSLSATTMAGAQAGLFGPAASGAGVDYDIWMRN